MPMLAIITHHTPSKERLTICQVILDSASSFGLDSTVARPVPDPTHPRLVVVSASSEKSLRKRIEHIEAYIQSNPISIADLAFTLGERREHLERRAFMLATKESATGSFNMSTASSGCKPEIIFVFTGQGSQWPAMGKSLMHSFHRFRSTIQLLDHALQEIEHPPNWSLQG